MKDSGDPPTLAESPHASLMDLETQTHDGDVSGPWSTQKPLVDDLIRISGFSINSRSLDKQSKALLLANSFGIEDLCDDDRVVLALLTIAYARFSLSQVWPIDDDDSDEAKEIALRAVGDFLVRREKPHLRERITSTCTSAAIGKVLSTLQTTRTYSPVDQIQNKIERALAWYVTGIRHPGSQMPGRFPKARSIITVRSFWDPRRFKGRQRQVERNALFTKVLRELSLRGLPFLVPWKASRGKDKRLVFSVRADVHTTLDVLNVWPTKSTTNNERSQVAAYLGTQQIPWFDIETQKDTIRHITNYAIPRRHRITSFSMNGFPSDGSLSWNIQNAANDNDGYLPHGYHPRQPSRATSNGSSRHLETQQSVIVKFPFSDHRVISGTVVPQAPKRRPSAPHITTGCDIFLDNPIRGTLAVKLPVDDHRNTISDRTMSSASTAELQAKVQKIVKTQEQPPVQEQLSRGTKRKQEYEAHERFSEWKRRVIKHPYTYQAQQAHSSSASRMTLHGSRDISPLTKSTVYASGDNWLDLGIDEVIQSGKMRVLKQEEDREAKSKWLTEQFEHLKEQRIKLQQFSISVEKHQRMIEAHRHLLTQHEEMMAESAALVAAQGKLLFDHNDHLRQWEDRFHKLGA